MQLIKRYLFNLLIAIDQIFNAILGGDPDHTISGRLGKCEKKWCRFICKILDIFDKNHCKNSIEWDRGDKAIWRL